MTDHRARHAVAVLAAVLIATTAGAQPDRVRMFEGSTSGDVVAVSREAVTVETDGRRTDVPVDRIRGVLFGGEPATLTQARINAENGGYQTALDKLAAIDAAAVDNPLVAEEIAYYTALCRARLAIAGVAPAADAGRALRDFAREHRDSFHYYGAAEAMGDLLSSLGRSDRAILSYGQLADASLAGLRVRGHRLAGLELQRAGDHDAAIRRFDEAAAVDADHPAAAAEQGAAELDKAASLAAIGRLDEGLEIARAALRESGEGDDALRAAAYNALGRCYTEAGRPTDALLAFLHTDLLFPSEPATHAEALYRLVPLWRAAGKPDDADDALAELRRRYGATPWARRAADGAK